MRVSGRACVEIGFLNFCLFVFFFNFSGFSFFFFFFPFLRQDLIL